MTQVVYSWKRGRIPVDAQVAGEHLEKLRIRNNGQLTPDQILSDAQKQDSPIHSAFEWDDTEAARQHRLSQARFLVRMIEVRYVEQPRDSAPTRAFVSVKRDGHPSYTSTAHAMTDAELREQVLQRAFEELKTWRQRYKDYKELADLFRQIEQQEQQLLAG